MLTQEPEMARHKYIGDSNAFSCSQTCGRLPSDPIHFSYQEMDLIEEAEIEQREAARYDGDPEC
jgi:hypothetical protein